MNRRGGTEQELIEQIDLAGPYGAGPPAPRYALPDLRVAHARKVGENHLKLALTDGLGSRLDAIAFNAWDAPMGRALAGHGGARFHFAGRLEINSWGGRRQVQLRLDDAAAVPG